MENRRKLKIAVLIKTFSATGGAEKYAVEIARKMAQRGHEVHVYAREFDNRITDGLTLHRVPHRMRFSSVLSLYAFAKEATRRSGGHSYDIVHAHDKGCMCDVATIHTFSYKHGEDRPSFLNKVNDFYLSPRGRLYDYLEKRQAKSHTLAAVSSVIRQEIRSYYSRTDDVRVVTPGVDVQSFSPGCHSVDIENEGIQADGSTRPGLKVLFVGSEFRRKGLDLLLNELPENARLTVVGRGERIHHYRQLVQRLGLDRRVTFKGLAVDIRKYYSLSDVLVLPSLREAFGMAALEAMACGLPVVVSSVAGVASLVENEKNGFVFKQSSELKGILKRLSDPELRKMIGENARLTAMNHTWDSAADQYEAIYWDIYDKKTKAKGLGLRQRQ